MPKICYISRSFSENSLQRIKQAVDILNEYARQGYRLTLRQLYYQCVSRGFIPNTPREYKNLGSIINDARLAGLIDWNHIEDRTRNLASNNHWNSPADIVSACASQFQLEKWADQQTRVEVWIEKEALAGIFAGVCSRLDVPYFCCRGYTSQSEMWAGARRMKGHIDAGQDVLILHFGDHDPSGIDMTRDIEDRVRLFLGDQAGHFTLKRIALNMPQIREYNPPPNPAKDTDSRHTGYLAEYGDESWELDALEPAVLVALVEWEVTRVRDEEEWADTVIREAEARRALAGAAEHWKPLVNIMEKKRWISRDSQ
jgi:hypothetical protein